MIRLNIRHKILMAIAVFATCLGSIAALSFSNLSQLERSISIVEKTDDLNNLVLEIRLLEKNQNLYEDRGLFTLGPEYIRKIKKLIREISEGDRKNSSPDIMKTFASELYVYSNLITKIRDGQRSGLQQESATAKRLLRKSGKRMLALARSLSATKRQGISHIEDKLRQNLITALSVVGVVTVLLVAFLFKSILDPLSRVQNATRSIASGTFTPLEIKNSNDEIQQVFSALNTMEKKLRQRQEQLIQARKLSSIGTLSSGIAHQLNNPLNNISTSCQLLRDNQMEKDEFADKMMGNIEQETLRARDIVRCLLDFARYQEYSPAKSDLKAVLERALKLAGSRIPANIRVHYDIPDDIEIPVDFQRMQEVFINLVINAVQAIEPEPGQIRIIAGITGKKIFISVRDSGSGITAEVMERIFDPFFTTKEVGQGTGLGLSVAYGIIEQAKGEITVSSAPDSGTEFLITFPAKQGPENEL